MAVIQRSVVLDYRLPEVLKSVAVSLNIIHVGAGKILLRLQVFTYHPLTQRSTCFADIVINKSEKIPGINIIFIQAHALPETCDSPAEVMDLCSLQTLIIKMIRCEYYLSVYLYIRTAFRAIITLVKLSAAFITIHLHSYLNTDALPRLLTSAVICYFVLVPTVPVPFGSFTIFTTISAMSEKS